MEFYQSTSQRLGLRNIPTVLAELLRQIPQMDSEGNEAVEARLFPDPTGDPHEDDLRQDWRAHVQPELHEWFQSSRQVVAADLRSLTPEEEGVFTLEFPVKHAPAWLNALNQARLSLAAEYDFDEDDLSRNWPVEIHDERALALLKINFYAAVQHWLVEVVDP